MNDRLDRCARDWGVTVESTLDTRSSILAFGTRDDRAVVLKVVRAPGDEWRAGEILAGSRPPGRAHGQLPPAHVPSRSRPHPSGPIMDHPHLVLARVYEHIEPIDRGERYEDPLDDALKQRGAGRVTGGGSQLDELGAITFADLEIELADLGGALQVVAGALEAAGAPEGSELLLASDERVLRTFGKLQCLAVFLDGTSLPDEVYAELDFDAVVEELGAAAGEGSFRGFWQGPEETGLFFFGPDAEAMLARVEPALRRLPIGQNARIVVRHGKPSLNPREIRLPRH